MAFHIRLPSFELAVILFLVGIIVFLQVGYTSTDPSGLRLESLLLVGLIAGRFYPQETQKFLGIPKDADRIQIAGHAMSAMLAIVWIIVGLWPPLHSLVVCLAS